MSVGDTKVTVTAPKSYGGYVTTLTLYHCETKEILGTQTAAAGNTKVDINLDSGKTLEVGEPVCVGVDYSGGPVPIPASISGASSGVIVGQPKPVKVQADTGCDATAAYSDCNWAYTVAAGGEWSGSSSLGFQGNAFVDLFARIPIPLFNKQPNSVWGEFRFLGAPTNSATPGIGGLAADPTSNITTASLSTVGTAVDYVVGYQYDIARMLSHPISYGLIAYGGATTPISSQNPTQAYVLPAYGSTECDQLHRFFSADKKRTVLPASGNITTVTTTTVGGTTTSTSTSTSPMYCAVQSVTNFTTTSLAGTTVTTQTNGVQQTNIAYVPQDAPTHLLKYGVGVRMIRRAHVGDAGTCATNKSDSWSDNCTRSVADIVIGQDASVTGGMLRYPVMKGNLAFQIPGTFVYFYGSVTHRFVTDLDRQNMQNIPLLQPATTAVAGSSGASSATAIVPSLSTFTTQLRQADRDFIRFGIALDISKVFTKIFTQPSTSN